jgi:hypothetical protein
VHRVPFLKRVPYLFITVIATLALAAVYAFELSAWRSPAKAAPATEPVFFPPGGYFDQDVQLEIDVPVPDASVIFTLDGSVPTQVNGTIYTHPLHLRADAPAVAVVRARGVLPDGELGPVTSASYFVGLRATLPMLSLIMEPDDLWGSEGIYLRPVKRGDEWERSVDVTYVDRDRRSGFHVPAGIRIHGGHSRLYEKKALRLYFRQEYGVSRLEYPLFPESDVRSFKRLVLHNGGQDWSAPDVWNWTLIRNQLADRLALELDGRATYSQPALLFLNGEPWGIYTIRERIDRHFLMDRYGIQEADLLDVPENTEQASVLWGDREHWDRLMQFVEAHDLVDSANYAYVRSQVDLANFIDYNIVQLYAAHRDWPHHNVRQFRPRVPGGRWQWMVWDTDHAFAALPGGRVDANLVERVLSYDHPETEGREVLLFRKLLENPVFHDLFLSRTADLLNTTLAPQSVVGHIDALAAELGPDITYETARWGSVGNWAANVEEMREFAHFRPDIVRQHMVEGFGLGGTAELVFNSPSSGSGTVAVNGAFLEDLPWQGVYFQGVPVRITAVPMPGYRFAGWDPPGLPQMAAIRLTPDGPLILTPRFEATGDDAPRSGDVVFSGYPMGEDNHIEGGRFELRVVRFGGVDLRGWRVTDNDTKTATDEGSLVFADNPAFAHVPSGTTILIVLGQAVGDHQFPQDDVDAWDRRMVLYAGNSNLDTAVDPGFNLGPNDNLALLSPGPSDVFEDDVGIAFISNDAIVTPASFGVLPAPIADGTQSGRWMCEKAGDEKPVVWLFVLVGLIGLCLLGSRFQIAGRRT